MQSVLNNNEYNVEYCREFMIYTKYLETFSKAPEDVIHLQKTRGIFVIIDIFGDSFSDTSIKQQDTDTWTDILRNKYKFNLRNYSKHGTDRNGLIEQFLKLETHVIIFSSALLT